MIHNFIPAYVLKNTLIILSQKNLDMDIDSTIIPTGQIFNSNCLSIN